MVVEPDLAVSKEYRQLRSRECAAILATLGELIVGRQKFQGPIQVARALERADEILVFAQARAGVQLEGADRLALQIVVAQYQRGDLVGHTSEQLVALAASD